MLNYEAMVEISKELESLEPRFREAFDLKEEIAMIEHKMLGKGYYYRPSYDYESYSIDPNGGSSFDLHGEYYDRCDGTETTDHWIDFQDFFKFEEFKIEMNIQIADLKKKLRTKEKAEHAENQQLKEDRELKEFNRLKEKFDV